MSPKPPDINNSISMSGGTINAQAIALGPNARATVNNAAPVLAAVGRTDVLTKLNSVLDTIETHGAALPDKATANQLVERIALETARKEPDKLNLKSFLGALADEVKSVSVIAGAVTALVASVGALF